MNTNDLTLGFEVDFGGIPIYAEASVRGPTCAFYGEKGNIQANIGEVLDDIGKSLGVSMTDFFKLLNININFMSFSYDNNKNTDINIIALLPVGGENIECKISIKYCDSVGGIKFEFEWKDENKPIDFKKLAKALGFEFIDIPDAIDLSLKNLEMVYQYGEYTEFLLLTASMSGGKAIFYAEKKSKWKYTFYLPLYDKISLPDIPMVSKVLASNEEISINDISLCLNMVDDVNTLKNKIESFKYGHTNFPQIKIDEDAALIMSLSISDVTCTIAVPPSSSDSTGLPQASMALVRTGYKDENASSALIKWFTIQKALGPVTFKRIGIKYSGDSLDFIIDAVLITKSLTISLDGLLVGINLKSYKPMYHLDGLGIAYSNPPVLISGALLAANDSADVCQYSGQAVIQTEALSLSALGAYSKVGGDSSLFVFAEIDHDFGGPPYCYITGLMAGFGYNRKLMIPSQDEVIKFPLIAGLSKPNNEPLSILEDLEGKWIVEQSGEDWLAVGIKFTSFELVNSKVLLIAEFGQQFHISVLGESVLKMPQDGNGSFVYVEMGLEALVKPENGFFGATAVLSSNSYVIDPGCRLTGGFAFYSWYSGEHEGDFVITAGGYHPSFIIPSHYPQVSRLCFNWPVSDSITISGEAYFALTPSCVMGGGSLEVLYQHKHLKAWFDAYADFLVEWKPFYYTANIRVSVGVSYRLNLLFTHVTLKAEIGASLSLWGPPTGGTVHINWHIISFDIGFGADRKGKKKALEWHEVKENLLPQKICNIKIKRGMQKTTSDAWIVRADEFGFFTESAIPADTVKIQIGQSQSTDTHILDTCDKVSMRPMNTKNKLTSTICISVKNNNPDNKSNAYIDISKTWEVSSIKRNIPESLWGDCLDNKPPPPAANTLIGHITGAEFTIKKIQTCATTLAIDIKNYLKFEPMGVIGNLPFEGTYMHANTNKSVGQILGDEVPTSLPAGFIQFYDNYMPNLYVGDYSITITQTVNGDGIDDNITDTQNFSVRGPRFALDPLELYSFMPSADSMGQYDNYLPHIVLNKRALPWENKLVSNNNLPWVALLLFSEDQLEPSSKYRNIARASPTRSISTTVGQLLAEDNDETGRSIRKPKITLAENDDDLKMACFTIEISLEAFKQVVPYINEVEYLAHVREINTGDAQITGTDDNGWYSVVLCNRFPSSNQNPNGAVNIVHLVSLEGLDDILDKAGQQQEAANYVRLISLARWSFTCKPDSDESFEGLMEGIVDNASRLKSPDFQMLKLPPAGVNVPSADNDQFLSGFVKLAYRPLQGQDTFGWYRGPLTPVLCPYIEKSGICLKAPSNTDMPAQDGIYDKSFASAWQIGRSLALSDKSFTTDLMNFRRQGHRVTDMLMVRLKSQCIDPEKSLQELTANNLMRDSFVQAMDSDFCKVVADILSSKKVGAVNKKMAKLKDDDDDVIQQLKSFMVQDDVKQLLNNMAQCQLFEVAQWLGQLILLKGIPFNYLVPDQSMLPMESIRFFHIDQNWLDYLVGGALSTGAVSSRDVFYLDLMEVSIQDAVKAAAMNIRQELTGKEKISDIEEYQQNEPMTGMLMRSDAVAAYPGMVVNAFNNGKQLDMLRSERLSPNILICIFSGIPDRVEINQPHQVLHFGTNKQEQLELRKLVDPVGAPVLDGNNCPLYFSVKAAQYFRDGSSGVLNIDLLQKDICDKLGVKPPLGAGGLGIELVNAPSRLVYQKG